MDSDGDGVGDNEQKAQEEKDAARMQLIIVIGVLVVLAGVGGVLFMRRRASGQDPQKETTPLPEIANADLAQPLYPTQDTQPAQQLAAAPTVENQWTDENGHTWRRMSDGSTLWWNGNDWQNV